MYKNVCRLLFCLSVWALASCAAPGPQPPLRSEVFVLSYRQGLDLLERYRLREAEHHFERCIQLDPGAYEGHWQLGRLHLMQGRIEDGIASLHRAWELEPGLQAARQLILETYLGRGKEALEQGRFKEARHYFAGALNVDSTGYEPLYQSALAALWLKDNLAADSLFRKTIDHHPAILKVRWHYLQVQLLLGRNPKAMPAQYRFPDAIPDTGNIGGRFTEVAKAMGVNKFNGGRSSGWADFDGDGDLDLAALGHPELYYYRNDGGHFANLTKESGLILPEGGIGTQVADYDNDGDADVYITRDGWFGPGKKHLFQNDGRAHFKDVTDQAGVGNENGSTFCASWGDFDRDGWLDIYLGNGTGAIGDSTNVLFRNNHQGTFTDVAARAGVDNRKQTLSTAFGDYDGDGWPDLYLENFTQPNVLYHNNGNGTFTDVTAQTGTAADQVDGFITFFLDYNNDGLLDIFVGNWSQYDVVLEDRVAGRATHPRDRSVLLRNNGNSTFTDVAEEAGLARALGTMSGVPGDFDYDGYLDLFLGNGGPTMERRELSTMFRNNGNGTFADVTAQVGVLNLGKLHGVTFADYDQDGDLDLYTPVGGARPGDQWENTLYRNEGFGNHWIVFQLKGTRSNRDGIGAKIRVKAGDLFQFAEVASGYSFGCSNSLEQEFGLGKHSRVDQVEVQWPSGQIDRYQNLEADRFVLLEEGAAAPKKVR